MCTESFVALSQLTIIGTNDLFLTCLRLEYIAMEDDIYVYVQLLFRITAARMLWCKAFPVISMENVFSPLQVQDNLSNTNELHPQMHASSAKFSGLFHNTPNESNRSLVLSHVATRSMISRTMDRLLMDFCVLAIGRQLSKYEFKLNLRVY